MPEVPTEILNNYKNNCSTISYNVPESEGAVPGGFTQSVVKAIENCPPNEWLESAATWQEHTKQEIVDTISEKMEKLKTYVKEMFDPIKEEIGEKIAEMTAVETSEAAKETTIASAEEAQEKADATAMEAAATTDGGVPKGVFDSWVASFQGTRTTKETATTGDDTVKTAYMLKAKAAFIKMQADIAASYAAIAEAVAEKQKAVAKLMTDIMSMPDAEDPTEQVTEEPEAE